MNKLLICIPFLTSCALFDSRIEYVEVSYPILVCPAPPILERPKLYIADLTSDDYKDYGKIARYYDITIEQLLNYIESLELVVDRYDKTSIEYTKLKEDFESSIGIEKLKNGIEK